MRTIVKYTILLLICATLAQAEVIVYQVLYDPLGTESGGEAIELKNNGREPVDISGWVLATDASEKDATIPANSILMPGNTYLIADENWDEKKDDLAWRSADHEETITLGNKEGWARLMEGDKIHHEVSWNKTTPGKAIRQINEVFEEAQADFFEGIPVALTADVTIQVPVIEISPALHLAPEAVLKIKNNGKAPVEITLRVGGLSYKNYTLPAEAVQIEGPMVFSVPAESEQQVRMKVKAPENAQPGKYTSTLRVLIE